jgi:hypothetical protein
MESSFAVPITSAGKFIVAEVAKPPSPLKLAIPVPAMVVINPVDTSTIRIRSLVAAAKYTSPVTGDTHTPYTVFTNAEVAAPPSPL